jgi:hypothetical protein
MTRKPCPEVWRPLRKNQTVLVAWFSSPRLSRFLVGLYRSYAAIPKSWPHMSNPGGYQHQFRRSLRESSSHHGPARCFTLGPLILPGSGWNALVTLSLFQPGTAKVSPISFRVFVLQVREALCRTWRHIPRQICLSGQGCK